MKHTDVYDVLLRSPYRGVQRHIHLLLLMDADGASDGATELSVKQLAKLAGCSSRYVRQTIAKMKDDGSISVAGVMESGVVRYRPAVAE